MDDKDFLAEQFQSNRPHLRAVAYRMLGSASEAEDAVQEAWLRLSRADAAAIDNLGGWLTTVVARICLDLLRARKSRREEPLTSDVPEPITTGDATEQEMLLGESIGTALLVVLDTLNPAERVAFVLHDMFDLPFEQIAPIVGRSPVAARQLASRARRRVQGTEPADRNLERQQELAEAFLKASKDGDLAGLLAVLAPDVVFRADEAATKLGGLTELRGAPAVAQAYKGRAKSARLALIDGSPGFAVILGGELRIAVRLTMAHDKIVGIEAVGNPDVIRALDVEVIGQ